VDRKATKSQKIITLLKTTDYSAADISDIAHCSDSLVTHQRRKLNFRSHQETIAWRISRMEREVRELRDVVRQLAEMPPDDVVDSRANSGAA
jgi:hypothetical protein